MKKKLSALLCALGMAMALCLTAFAAGTPSVKAEASVSDKQVKVVLTLDGVDAAYAAAQCDVKYDADQLAYNGYEEGSLFINNTANAIDSTTVRVVGDVGTKDSITAGGVIGTVVFDVKGEAETTDISIDKVIISDDDATRFVPMALGSL